MKKLLFLILSVYGVSFASTPIELDLPIDHVFVPKGFDSNDSAEIIVKGTLPNLCHKTPTTEVKIEGRSIHISLKSLYYDQTDYFCPPAVLPFEETVRLGVLDKGMYQVSVNAGRNAQKGILVITEASISNVDDFLYANVEYVQRINDNKIKLMGVNPSHCFSLKRIDFVSNDIDTYSVLPILKQTAEDCPYQAVPFEYIVDVPSELAAKQILIHVRGMKGKSVNKVLDRR